MRPLLSFLLLLSILAGALLVARLEGVDPAPRDGAGAEGRVGQLAERIHALEGELATLLAEREGPAGSLPPPRRAGPSAPPRTGEPGAGGSSDDAGTQATEGTVDVLGERLAELEQRIASLEEETPDRVDRAAIRALNAAFDRKDAAEVLRLLESGVDVNARDGERRTPLAAAAVAGDPMLLDLLIERGADLELTSGRRRMTPLLAALDAGQEESALRLIDRGADVRAVDKNGESALIWASYNGMERVVELLIEDGVGVDFTNHWGSTALHGAARKGRLDVVERLLGAGADPNQTNDNGETALDLARGKKQRPVAELLRRYGAR